jgi:hypothetical protein
MHINPLTPNDTYSGRTAPLTSKVAFYIFIQQIKVLNILNMVYTPRFFLQNAVCFIILTYLVPVLFTFYIQDVLKLKKNNNSSAKRLKNYTNCCVCRKFIINCQLLTKHLDEPYKRNVILRIPQKPQIIRTLESHLIRQNHQRRRYPNEIRF